MINSYIPKLNEEKQKESIKKYLDYCKKDKLLYNNIFLCDCNYIIKYPLNDNGNLQEDIKIKRFNLVNHIYLGSY